MKKSKLWDKLIKEEVKTLHDLGQKSTKNYELIEKIGQIYDELIELNDECSYCEYQRNY